MKGYKKHNNLRSCASLNIAPKSFSVHCNYGLQRAKQKTSAGKTEEIFYGKRVKESGREKDEMVEDLEYMEKKVTEEERKLMFISDLRTSCENNRLMAVPSVVELPHSSSMHVLSKKEILICFLLTPRNAKIVINDRTQRVLINLIPDESKYSIKREKYLLECRELSKIKNCPNVNPAFLCEIDEIERFERETETPNLIKMFVRRQPVIILFTSSEDCAKYAEGLNFLLYT